VSVDTYLKRKNLSRYQQVEHEGLTVHLAPALLQWAEEVHVDAERSLFVFKRFLVDVAHRHRPT
jgi:hypothetical protein